MVYLAQNMVYCPECKSQMQESIGKRIVFNWFCASCDAFYSTRQYEYSITLGRNIHVRLELTKKQGQKVRHWRNRQGFESDIPPMCIVPWLKQHDQSIKVPRSFHEEYLRLKKEASG